MGSPTQLPAPSTTWESAAARSELSVRRRRAHACFLPTHVAHIERTKRVVRVTVRSDRLLLTPAPGWRSSVLTLTDRWSILQNLVDFHPAAQTHARKARGLPRGPKSGHNVARVVISNFVARQSPGAQSQKLSGCLSDWRRMLSPVISSKPRSTDDDMVDLFVMRASSTSPA